MNFFSVLDDSDNDEPKVAKTAAKKTTAAPTAGGAAAPTAKKAPAAVTSAPKKDEKAKTILVFVRALQGKTDTAPSVDFKFLHISSLIFHI